MILCVYLENVGNSTLRVVTGKLISPSIAPRNALYYGDLKRTPNGRVVKPTPGELDIVELKPGEIAELETIIVPIWKSLNEYTTIYHIGEPLGVLAGCWRGEIETTFDIPWPELKAASLYHGEKSNLPNKAAEPSRPAGTAPAAAGARASVAPGSP